MGGVWSERQCCIQCDICCDNETCATMNMADFKKFMRKKGWSIGFIVLCPKCREEMRKDNAD